MIDVDLRECGPFELDHAVIVKTVELIDRKGKHDTGEGDHALIDVGPARTGFQVVDFVLPVMGSGLLQISFEPSFQVHGNKHDWEEYRKSPP